MNGNTQIAIFERLRRSVFWFIGRFRTFRYSDEINRIAGYHADPAAHESDRREQLQELLWETQKHVPFYRDSRPGKRLEDWPVVTKDMIRDAPERFRHIRFDAGSLSRVTTSGSSGQPFECFHERKKVRHKLADLLYYNGLAGYEVGMCHMLVRATPKPKWKLWLQNEIWIDPTRRVEKLFAHMRARLLQSAVRVVIGYPSVMADLANYCQQMGDAPHKFCLRGYIATSEMLWGQQRDIIQDVFGCRVVSRYASEEFGVLGQSEEDLDRFNLNTRSVVVEVLDSDDQPVKPGALGRVVVTDLTMRQMPLIRYDLGDLAVAGEPADGGLGVTSITSLEGKSADTISDSGGTLVAPLAIVVALKEARDIRQFQFSQLADRNYELRISPETAKVEKAILEKLSSILGEGAEIMIRNMAEIPSLRSGKRPVVVNDWKRRQGRVHRADL